MKNEMHYRIAKYIIKTLYENGTLTLEQSTIAQMQLLERFNPPFHSVEEIGDFYEKDRENRGNKESGTSKQT
ncbi:MAG TPA: hypothetical protein PLS20_01165 [Ruminococcus flavefaciens]|nr:hypothetical protein [Ruminococcus flavefaciens]